VIKLCRGRVLHFMWQIRKLYKDQLVQEARNRLVHSTFKWQDFAEYRY